MKLNAFLVGLIHLLSVSVWASGAESTRIRVVTSNLTTGSKQSYDNGEGARILKGLKPDVVLIQEFNYKTNSAEDLREFVTTTFSEEFQYYRESEATDQIPNGVISRYPLIESGEWTDADMPNRDFAWARIDIPGDQDFWAISVHLSAKKSDVRMKEAAELVRLMEKHIPSSDYIVLGGDFNLTSRADKMIEVLAPQVSEVHAPHDSLGFTTTNMTNKKNFDWILNDSDLAGLLVSVDFLESPEEKREIGVNTFPFGLVFDSTTFPLLDRLKPIEKSDSRSPGMQHLAVVKDYLIPVKK